MPLWPRIIGVQHDQVGDLVPLRDEAGRWNAMPGLTAARRVADWEYAAMIGDPGRVKAGALAAAGPPKPVTMAALFARSGSWLRGAA